MAKNIRTRIMRNTYYELIKKTMKGLAKKYK